MKREETLLSAMGGMEEDFLMEAENYRKARGRTLRKGMIAIAAVVALMVTSATVLATNDTWRNTIRGWLGIGESSASGYAEYDDQTVRMGGLTIQQVSTLCSGDQLVTFLEVTPPDGETISSDLIFESQLLIDESKQADTIDFMYLAVVSSTPNDVLLKLTVGFVDMSAMQALPFRCFTHINGTYGTDWTDADVVYSDKLELEIVDTPMLSGEMSIPLENNMAASTGEVMAIRVCSGSLEIIWGHEYFETWCDRICVPDSGKTFLERYTGKEWTPGTPESDGEAAPHFTSEDEIAIAQAFQASWEDTVNSVLDTVTITQKDGSVLELQENPTVSYNQNYTQEGVDAYTYRYTILPLISSDDIQSVEIGGQVVEMTLISQAN